MTHTNATINDSNQARDEHPTPLNPQGYSRIKPTAELIGLHHQTLRRWWKADKFPKPIDMNGIPMFRNSDILRFIENQQSACKNNTATTTAPVTNQPAPQTVEGV